LRDVFLLLRRTDALSSDSVALRVAFLLLSRTEALSSDDVARRWPR
jgi:hypothetical protein